MASSRTLIESQTLASSAASVTFNSIPSTYTDIVVKASVRTDYAAVIDYLIIRFNSDSSTNYSDTRLVAYAGTGTLSDRTSSATSLGNVSVDGNSATSSTFSNTEIYIPNYLSTVGKPISASTVVENNSASANQIVADAALYRGASAISNIAFTPSVGTNFLSGSSFYLYGIKNS
jgi:hypothetical protein